MLRYFFYLMLTFWVTQVLADDILIVASTSPLYEKGQQLKPKTALQLKAGESISFRTLQNEEIYTQKGPYVEPIDQNADTSTLLEKIITLVSLRSMEKTAAQLNQIDVLQDNAFCFEKGEKVVLWRPHVEQTQTLLLKNKQTEQIVKEDWLAGEHTLPFAFDLQDEQHYLVELSGKFSKLSLYQLPTDLIVTYQANWLLEKKCIRQAKLLLVKTINNQEARR